MRLEPDYPVRTSRLLLRPLVPADRPALLAYRSIPDVCRYVPFEPMDLVEIDRRLSAQWNNRTLEAPGDALTLGVVEGETGRLIGDAVLFWRTDQLRTGEIGYIFSPDAAGQGYATEAGAALLALAFDSLGLHRVIGRLDDRNLPSARVLERLGMRQEAHLAEDDWAKGEWTSTLIYALLESEWAASPLRGSALPR